jgi:hypothetical protein
VTGIGLGQREERNPCLFLATQSSFWSAFEVEQYQRPILNYGYFFLFPFFPSSFLSFFFAKQNKVLLKVKRKDR